MWAAALCCAVALQAAAQEAAPSAADPALEARVRQITAELRCLVCQNETIAESSADLARDLRAEVTRMLRAGRSEAEIQQFMTDRYGDFVRYRPPLKPSTLLLWWGPPALLAGGLLTLWAVLQRRSRLSDDCFEPDEEPDAPAGVDEGGPP
ncbi:cytochrome C biogenesis protein [Caldimonas brevitalea]|uniref:Cytochrome c-type biogenesis protein n=1 Tax=Caldimonas brevitalea TaxID=413882 RepID=A0A0G3BIM8_9BURK|nr:cytochrome C biogenesis protein [Caldimonas brevitalea]